MALLLFLSRKEIKDSVGQKFMNENISSMQSTELFLRAVQNTRVKFSHGEHPNQIKHRVTERLQTDSLPLFFFMSIRLDEWMSVPLGNMKILGCRKPTALHSHTTPIKKWLQSPCWMPYFCILYYQTTVDPTTQIQSDSQGEVLYISCISTASGIFYILPFSRGNLIVAFHSYVIIFI